MDETTPFSTRAWESFYVIVGSSAGALTGLQFVVLTLITEAGMIRGTGETCPPSAARTSCISARPCWCPRS